MELDKAMLQDVFPEAWGPFLLPLLQTLQADMRAMHGRVTQLEAARGGAGAAAGRRAAAAPRDCGRMRSGRCGEGARQGRMAIP